jgi:tRNA(adenine34) deaminase
MLSHDTWMAMALREALAAQDQGEVPVGALLISETGRLLAAAHNQPIGMRDPTAHAEILALRQACVAAQNYRLPGTTLYVTIEPCVMCMGAIVHARISRVVFGAPDLRWGAAGSLYDLSRDSRLNHHPEIIGGVLADRCREVMQAFFRARRPNPMAP